MEKGILGSARGIHMEHLPKELKDAYESAIKHCRE